MKSLPKIVVAFLVSLVLTSFFIVFPVKADISPAVCDVATLALFNGDTAACQKYVDAINAMFQGQPANGPWYNQNPQQFASKVLGGSQDEIFGERYTFAQINWIINSLATMLNPAAGIRSPSDLFNFLKTVNDAFKAISYNRPPSVQDYAKLGAPGFLGVAIGSTYAYPPASGIHEGKVLAEKVFNFTTGSDTAYAQGVGYLGLTENPNNAIKVLWTASRNSTYLLIIVFLIASGFLIMFRVKINPQTVISIQTLIPKLIIALLLITFSFAIAGLIIDLIYVVLVAFVGFLNLGGILYKPLSLTKFITSSGFTNYFLAQSITALIVATAVGVVLAIVAFGSLFAPGLGTFGLITSLLGLIIVVLIGVFWIWIMFKIALMLLKSYVMLIFQIILAPWQILLGLLPGQSGFSGWVRNTIAHASVFVVVPVMFVIQHILSGDLANFVLGIKYNFPLPTLGLPFLPNSSAIPYLLNWIVGFIVLSMTPKVAEIVRDALKIPAFKYGSAIGEATNMAFFGPRMGAGATAAQFEADLKVPGTTGWERAYKSLTAPILKRTEKGV